MQANGAFPGLSKSYFVTGFYDDGALQAGLSWSHRDKYFYGMVTSTEPGYTLGSSQWDGRVSYTLFNRLESRKSGPDRDASGFGVIRP